ncbi:MAG TPA: DUF1330 domain-containing protein [Miltoncostaeaceae bacterium]|nr:DUF1330 domain-containing protein [Miltoncostaeaceae bacterium]
MPAVLLARYTVADRERFIEVFDAFEDGRARAGAVARTLLAGDGGDLVALIEFPTAEAARAFAGSPERADALARATVTGRADEILDVARPRDAVAP